MLSFLFIFMFPFGIHREPTFQYTFALLENFFDGPERREWENAQQRRNQDVADEERTRYSNDSQYQENPPATGSPIIFSLDHDRVKQADDEESADADDEAFPVESVQ